MNNLHDEKDLLNCNDGDCLDVESCDCQGVCICEPGLEIDEEDEDCDNCCCDEDDDEDCDEFDLEIEDQDEEESI